MKNKKNTIMLIMIITISMVLLTWNKSYSYKMDNNEIEEKEVERKEFGIYLQESGENYTETDKFPDTGYLLNEDKTKCYEYGNDNVIQNAVEQSLTNGVIDGSIIVTSQKSMYCKIYFDKDEKPIVSSFNIKGKTSNNEDLNNGFTYNTGIYTINWQDIDVVQYCLSNNNSCTDWHVLEESPKASKTITIENNTFTSTEGSKTIYAYIKDKANNISEVKTGNITVDQTSPQVALGLTGTSVNPFTATSGYTHTQQVTYYATITEINLDSYCVGENSCSSNSPLSTTLISGQVTIGSQETSHTVVINIKDKAGNVGSKTQSITLDTENPTITLSNGTATETSITVNVNASDVHGISNVICTAVGNNETKTGTYTNNACTFNDLNDDTLYSITVEATDGSGRRRTNTINVSTFKSLPAGRKRAKEVLGVVPKGISDNLLGDMYRFVGTKDTVDNWICFGYSNVTTDCKSETSDYMYRIIGITEDGKMKLIKNTAIKESSFSSYVWNKAFVQNKWPNSDIFKRLNGQMKGTTEGYNGNTNIFIDSKTSNVKYIKTNDGWYDKIEEHFWTYGNIIYGDMANVNLNADAIYKIENKFSENIQARIGLMYISDYYYSYSTSGKDSSTTVCSDGKCKNSWIYISNNGNSGDSQSEWTMVQEGLNGYDGYSIWRFNADGQFSQAGQSQVGSVRPVFYLNSDVKIDGGTGASVDPFIITA